MKKAVSTTQDQFVYIGEILNYETHNYLNYFPDDSTYVLSNEDGKRDAYLKALSGFGSMVDLRLYTDLLGTFGEQPNGLVQFEATSKIPLTALNAGYHYFLNFVQPFFKLSKLDSKYDTIALSPTLIDNRTINKMELFQRSFLNLGVKALIISGNDDLALFKELQFHNNHFGTSTGEIWSEKKSTELKEIKAAILAMPTHYSISGIKITLTKELLLRIRILLTKKNISSGAFGRYLNLR